jgi:hypothetical protein
MQRLEVSSAVRPLVAIRCQRVKYFNSVACKLSYLMQKEIKFISYSPFLP